MVSDEDAFQICFAVKERRALFKLHFYRQDPEGDAIDEPVEEILDNPHDTMFTHLEDVTKITAVFSKEVAKYFMPVYQKYIRALHDM